MLIYKKTSTLAVRHVFDPHVMGTVAEVVIKDGAKALGHIAEEVAGKVAGDWVKKVAKNVRSHFTDHSEKLTEALARSNERAWKTIEIALGGRRLWDRFASAEDQTLREQVRAFLESAVPGDDPDFLTASLKELRQARDKGHLAAGDGFRPESLAEEVGPFARFDDPEALLEAECSVVGEVAREFQRLGYRHLGRLLAVTPTHGQPLLAMAVQYYFRREVGEDAVLSRELSWTKMVGIDRRVQDGFAFLASIQERHGRTLEEALDGLTRVEVVVVETRDAVLDLHADVRGLTDQFRLLRRELTPGHSVSYRDEHERAVIEEVKRRYRALSDDQRRRFPQLGLDLSRLEIVAGDFPGALDTAREAANQLEDARAKAEAHHAAYRAALELKSWDDALAELQRAVAADPRFAIWPTTKYQVERILGAGAFGVAFLCHHRYKDRHVVLKTFEAAGIDRDVSTIFREAQILDRLEHPRIVRLLDCGFADEVRQQRPYLEIAHFPNSLTLENYVRQHGPLTPDDLLPMAVQIAEALTAAHSAGVLHRDVKPGNVLVRKTRQGWEIKVIDFGLSLRRSLIQTSQTRAASLNRSMVGSAVAGTLNYAAPEQLDPGQSGEIGPHSDVYGFGRSCYFALFCEPHPDQEDLDTLPQPWRDFLGRCSARKIKRRTKDFDAVLMQLAGMLNPRTSVEAARGPISTARSTYIAQFYTLEEAARVLGMSAEELNSKAQTREVRAFLDGGSWRFRVVDIDELARQRGLGSDAELRLSDLEVPAVPGSDEVEQLDLSEFQLGVARPDLGAETMHNIKPAPASGEGSSEQDILLDDLSLSPNPVTGSSSVIIGVSTSGKHPSDSDVRLVTPDAGLRAPSDSDVTLVKDDTGDHGQLTPRSGSDSGLRGTPLLGSSAEVPASESDSDFDRPRPSPRRPRSRSPRRPPRP